jgi:hypothetical protein
MNKYNSIIKYKNKINDNLFFKIKENLKLRTDLYIMLKDIKNRGVSKIEDEFKHFDPYPGYSKYLNIKPWFMDNLWRCYILGLNNSESKNILDIGTGNGYFPFICKKYGHAVRTIDIASNPLFNSLIELLEIPRREISVSSNEALPAFDVKFDLVTGFHTYFNGHRTENVWTSKEWHFFLKDLKENHCNSNASAYFIINKEHNRVNVLEDELRAYFISIGSEIDGDRVYIPDISYVK